MEVPLQPGSPTTPAKETFRTVKPPDQCVISYNFEHAGTLNFTHNLLIGMGLDEPTRKQNSSVASSSKQKLFSIIPQPKKVFRNEPASVSKAYSTAIMPKRYAPSTHKPRMNPNYSQHAPSEPRERNSNQRGNCNQQEHSLIVVRPTQRDTFQSVQLISPYGTLGKKKTNKTSFNKNQKGENSITSNNTPQKMLMPKLTSNIPLGYEDEMEHTITSQPENKGLLDASNLIKEVSQDKQSQSNLQQNIIQPSKKGLSVEENSRENMQAPQKSSFINAKQNSSLSIKLQQVSKPQIPKSNLSIEPVEANTTENLNQPNANPAFSSKETQSGNCKQRLMFLNGIDQEQGKVKSKKEIQDQQLQELEARVRKQESGKFKKGYFRVSSSKDKEVLPYQAGIEPLFTNHPKQSITQLPTKNASTNSKGNLFNPSKVDGKMAIEQVARSSGFTSNSFNLAPSHLNTANQIKPVNQNHTIKPTNQVNPIKAVNQDNKITQRNANSKASRFASPTAQPKAIAENQQKENTKTIPTLKRQSNNLTNIVAPQKIKRVTQDLNTRGKNMQAQAIQKNRQSSNEQAEDLTANNQIKGFKIPEKVISKAPKISKVESHASLMQRSSTGLDGNRWNEELKKKKNEGKQGQNSPTHSSAALASANNINSIKRTSNESNQRSNRNNKRSPNSNNKSPANKPTVNILSSKQQSNSDKHRYSEIGPDIESKRKAMDQVINEEKTNNAGSKKVKPRANQSAFVGLTSKSTDKRKTNEKPLQPTVARQALGKDHKLKKWRDAQLQELQKQRSQSKKRELSNASKSKQHQPKQNTSRMRPKKSQIIDLDAEEEDKFGLRSLRRPNPGNSGKKVRKGKGAKIVKSVNTEGIEQQQQYEEGRNSEQLQNNSGQQYIQSQRSSESDSEPSKQGQKQQKQQDQGLMDQNLDRISSIHSSKITEQQEQLTERLISQSNRKSLSPRQNLQDLLKATQESPSLNNHHGLPLEIQFENSNIAEPITHQQPQAFVNEGLVENSNAQIGNNHNNNEVNENQMLIQEQQNNEPQKQIQKQQQNAIQTEKQQILIQKQQDQAQNNKSETPLQQQNTQPIVPIVIPAINANIENVPVQQNEATNAEVQLQRALSNEQRMKTPLANLSNAKQEDFFQYNIKEMSKFNETVNQTFNNTKYETFDRDLAEYTRAPIISFIYGHSQTVIDSINSFQASSKRINILEQAKPCEPVEDGVVGQAIDILLSIDHWIIQRIFEPFLSENGEIGVWLYWQGQWEIVQVSGQNFRVVLRKAISKVSIEKGLQFGLEDVLRLISGVRVARLKSSKKRVLSELDYSLNKKHVLKAVTAKNSKWGQRMFEVVKVEVSKQGGNVLKLKQRSEYFWVREEKFQQIFQHFLLICTRPSHFWTNTLIASKESHKSVISLGSVAATHGSVTLYYPSQQRSSLCFYKQLQSKVLKFMGRIQQKANQNGNLYFQFRMHGTYYLFLETPADCKLAIESTTKLMIGEPDYIASETLKNDRCEYVEIEHARTSSSRPASKQMQMETLEKLREKFINMVSTK